MVGRESALHLLKTLVQQSPADQTEAILLTEDSSLTRFAGSAVHQHVARETRRSFSGWFWGRRSPS